MHLNKVIISFFYFVISLIVTNVDRFLHLDPFSLSSFFISTSSSSDSLSQFKLDLWAWELPVTVLILGWSPLVAQSRGGCSFMSFRVGDLVIFSEVGYEVVHWVTFLAGWYPSGEGLS